MKSFLVIQLYFKYACILMQGNPRIPGHTHNIIRARFRRSQWWQTRRFSSKTVYNSSFPLCFFLVFIPFLFLYDVHMYVYITFLLYSILYRYPYITFIQLYKLPTETTIANSQLRRIALSRCTSKNITQSRCLTLSLSLPQAHTTTHTLSTAYKQTDLLGHSESTKMWMRYNDAWIL